MSQSVIGLDRKQVCSEDHDCLPLKKRPNLLSRGDREVKLESCVPISPGFDVGDTMAENKYHELGDSKNLFPGCVAEDQKIHPMSRERLAGKLGEHNNRESIDPITMKVECADENLSPNITNGSFSDEKIQTANFDTESSDKVFDELDHLVLKERLKRLLMSKFLPAAVLEENSGAGFGDQKPVLSENQICNLSRSLKSCSSKGDANVNGSTMLNLPAVKAEPSCCDAFQNPVATLAPEITGNQVTVKTEFEILDELDNMPLSLRKKLLQSKDGFKTHVKESSEFDGKKFSSNMGFQPVASQPVQPLKIKRPRKKRKTATDSVEIAMEEDAPGLLQVLVEKGVLVSEIKLYGEPESDDAVDDDSSEGNFGELESVISKLFTRQESLLDKGKFRFSKAEKPTYCLECLFSLVEQARYLQFRKWPAEWGWCRDLQSFIFVFERHNRIVLERPEYGYATYFFELAGSLSIDWQIKRLVIVMKFTSCSRSSLLENKSLVVGDDLSEGEARILMEYGWKPNTGLGTMLNYRDRVVHDRKNEKDRSEWRSKISKLLVDGYNCGALLNADIPVKAEECNAVQVKLEPR